jgi:hypothetical protein
LDFPEEEQKMTKLLTQAFEKASELPDDLQDQLTIEVLDEIEWEPLWDLTLANPRNKLEQMAEKAEKEYRSGKTKKMRFDEP